MRFLLVFVPMITALAASTNGVVLKPVSNMYSHATQDSDVVSQAIYGTRLGILEQTAEWAKVQTPDDYTGWMPKSEFRELRDGERAYASQGRVARVDVLFASLYRETDITKHAPVLTVPFETRLEITAEPKDDNGRWLRVGLADGRIAWLQRGDVTFDDKPLSMESLIPFSKHFLGLPYLWGGTSSYGYDCSGFVQMLYRRIGVMLPRDADQQAEWSGVVPVERKDLRPGDLLYFGASERKITHTGMYIGSGEFINATTHERPVIQIDKLDDQFWTKLLIAARRLK